MRNESDAQRTLTVCSESGLSNRLRVLLSGIALAEASGRQLRMRWPRTPACACLFSDLYEPGPPVLEGDTAACEELPLRGGVGRPLGDLLRAPEAHLRLRSPGWLIRPGQYAGHAGLYQRCQTLWGTLVPVAYVREHVEHFQRRNFRPRMIGIHLRRGDFLRTRPDVVGSLQQALTAIKKILARSPEAGLFLCTDDGARDPITGHVQVEGIRKRFVAQFGERVTFTTPRSLERGSPAAIQDALIDLYLLRRTDYLVGTRDSSFSEMAVFGREAEVALCRPGGAYPWVAALGGATGVFPMMNLLGRLQFRQSLPVVILLSHYVGSTKRWLAGLTGPRRPNA